MLSKKVLLLSLAVTMLVSCKTSNIDGSATFNHDNKYDSEFPSYSVSKDLKKISNSIKKMDIIAFYATYYFPKNIHVNKSSITEELLETYEDDMTISHESVSGTATVIYNNNNLVGLLTCAHVIDFPDSVFSYYDEDEHTIQTLSVKIKQQNHISGIPSGEPIEIIAQDTKKDIAILSRKTEINDTPVQTLRYPIGNVKDLQWGSIVYIMGYPLGNLMVTRALVSLSDKVKSGVFITDALYNHGISGSPVFAIRDGAPNFELVGMASSAAAQASNILVPDEDYKKTSRLKSNYDGKIFVDNNKLISYGVTFSVTITEIITFIHSNEKALTDKGFNMNDFFM